MNRLPTCEYRGFRGSTADEFPRDLERGRRFRRKYGGGSPFLKGRGTCRGCFARGTSVGPSRPPGEFRGGTAGAEVIV